ncbi:hypothetical protein [Parendozoicomonas haliclonae]|uniref:Uncharacterized protein n=1 Tax=Parendozoicomonas haliclonae TaxID=1960125 RepID=A0A1X7AI72_9GAMM|nr:hypothetical protein [Parendozoicomonas haliclonae]SMA43979.1 hypothetical protein EHSB41UT_01704 [Parendozoicomonas haliclonae]
MKNILRKLRLFTLFLTSAAAVSALSSYLVVKHLLDANQPEPYPVASLDLRLEESVAEENRKAFSDTVLGSGIVLINIVTPYDDGICGPTETGELAHDGEPIFEISCFGDINLIECDDIEGYDNGGLRPPECTPNLSIHIADYDAYNRVRECRDGFQITGFYRINYLAMQMGQAFYEAVPVPVDPRLAELSFLETLGLYC